MSELRTISPLSRALGLAGIFGLGALSHWAYLQFQAPGPEVDIFYQAPHERSSRLWQQALPTADDLLRSQDNAGSVAGIEVWRAENARQKQFAEKFTEQRATQASGRAAARAVRQLASLGRTVLAPAPLNLPRDLVVAGALARSARAVEQTIVSAAAVTYPHRIDGDRMMVAALRSQLSMNRQSRLALRQRLGDRRQLEQNLRSARRRIERLAEREIIRAAAVRLPVAPHASFRVSAGPVVAGISPAAGLATAAEPVSVKLSVAKAGFGVPPVPASLVGPASANAIDAINRAAAVAAPALVSSAQVLAYAGLPGTKAVSGSAVGDVVASIPAGDPVSRGLSRLSQMQAAENFDLTGVREAIAAFKKGDMEDGRAHARRVRGEVAKAAVEWAEVSLQPRKAGSERIRAFLERYPDWPKQRWLQWRAEQGLFVDKSARKSAAAYLARFTPASPIGQLVYARVLLASGQKAEASQMVSTAWRTGRFTTWLERMFLKDFRGQLSTEDLKFRADKQFYKERYSAALRLAGLAGKDTYRLMAASVAVARGGSPEKFGAKLTNAMRRDPVWAFAQAVRLRRSGKFEAAAKFFAGQKITTEGQVAPAAWWMERRMLARRLLDDGKPHLAYKVAAGHAVTSGGKATDAEFYAGWLALRFVKKPDLARGHFERALSSADHPVDLSRAAYWLGRSMEKGADPEAAEQLYAAAARHTQTYYGQLARARMLGTTALPIRRAQTIARAADRHLAVRVVDLLARADEDTMALRLAFGLGAHLEDKSQLAALAAIMYRERDARGSLVIGKLAMRRGIQLDDVAFPDFGIPKYVALANSADRSMVYAIARQESAFQAKAKSHAGARGLMQMLVSTARVTARRKGVPFDADRLTSDPAFNAQLGAAHLGDLMEEHPGSLTLVFAAYNAGGPRVKQWIKAYGDPRKPGVDPIDWVERIPIAETRLYVQRVTENLGVYRAMLGHDGPPHPAATEIRTASAYR